MIRVEKESIQGILCLRSCSCSRCHHIPRSACGSGSYIHLSSSSEATISFRLACTAALRSSVSSAKGLESPQINSHTLRIEMLPTMASIHLDELRIGTCNHPSAIPLLYNSSRTYGADWMRHPRHPPQTSPSPQTTQTPCPCQADPARDTGWDHLRLRQCRLPR